MNNDKDDLALDSFFVEPPRPPSPEPTIVTYLRDNNTEAGDSQWKEIRIRLVGSHSLWGHYLWNAAKAFASYLDVHSELCKNRFVLELGAGGGLPGIVAAKNGARHVVLTDYPDLSLIENLKINIKENIEPDKITKINAQGYLWGKPVDQLQTSLPENTRGFDLIIMSDLIFNYSQHDALLDTCDQALLSSAEFQAIEPCLLVFYTHHRPQFADRDLRFLEKARERRWTCTKVVTQKFPPMFPEDPGDEQVRSTVHGWKLERSSR